jgi:diaminopimelate decarboxylase
VTRDDELLIAGRTVTDVAKQVGRTPFYAYDRAALSARVRQLRETLGPDVKLHYAIKANPMPAVVAHMAPLVDGLDVASVGEMRVALGTGIKPELVSFAGPGKTREELLAAAQAGIVVMLESEREIEILAGAGTKQRPRVAIRVNPDFELKTSGMKMSGGPKQFGIDAERVPEVLRSLAREPIEFIGFHIFSGSQNLRPEAIVEAQRKSVELAIQLAKSAPGPVRMLNIGGGFGIPYFPGERALDLAPIARNLAELQGVVAHAFPEAELVLELGRYLVGEAGIYVCRVIDRKVSRGHTFLVTDGGLHQHLAASGNFGQVLRKNYPVVTAQRVAGAPRENVSVVGPLCTPLDLLADHMDLGHAAIGDLIVVLQSGAYGYTASPTRFLGHPEPEQILL